MNVTIRYPSEYKYDERQIDSGEIFEFNKGPVTILFNNVILEKWLKGGKKVILDEKRLNGKKEIIRVKEE